ncbi:DUF2252 family protein [Roseomonas sp. 18066]|uniref:DUF2252 family protein n=1 Tax=Roseomonas sp. 18066 TaxID=2681412 RepID=UPI001359E284|nr:DUF2252 family protein [Roseomonas sp. 18066]
MDIIASTAAYEAFLRQELGAEVVEEALLEKRARMAEGAFPFLRATYWRWAEQVGHWAPALMEAPALLAVGDIHLENFGTWRDAEGRLIWGVNDYDEAAEMPYTLDLLRLATSGLLADPEADAREIARPLLAGYAAGLEKPRAAVLDRELDWLRALVVVPESQRAEFWAKLKKKRKKFQARAEGDRPFLWPRYREALLAALPRGAEPPEIWYRSAGLGSLGRPRWVARAQWHGDWVIREAKGVVPSGWTRGRALGRAIRCMEIATGRYRAPDPWYRVVDGVAVRRLSPNNHKIGTDKVFSAAAEDEEGGEEMLLGRAVLLQAPMLEAMGRELAAIHLGQGHLDRGDPAAAIAADFAARPKGWLAEAAIAAAEATRHEQAIFAKAQGG